MPLSEGDRVVRLTKTSTAPYATKENFKKDASKERGILQNFNLQSEL